MPAPHVTALLPSGKQMQELDLPSAVVDQVEALALQILQRSFAPIVLRHRGRAARQQLLLHLLETAYNFADLESAVEHAFTFTSALGQCMPGLDEDELARILKYKAAASSGTGLGSTSKLLSTVLAGGDSPAPAAAKDDADQTDDGAESGAGETDAENRSQTRAPGSDVGSAEQSLNGTSTPSSKPPRPTPPSISPEHVAGTTPTTAAAAATSASSPHARTSVDVDALAKVRDALRQLIKEHATFTAYLEGEKIQWAREPATQVLVLLTGTLERAAPHPPVSDSASHGGPGAATALMTMAGTTTARSRLASLPFSPNAGVAYQAARRLGPNSGQLSGTTNSTGAGSGDTARRPSSALDAQVRMMSAAAAGNAGGQDAGASAGSSRRASTVLQGIAAAVAASKLGDVSEEILAAPLVLGEAACLGGFPYCADLVVSAPVAIVACVSKADYVALLEAAPRPVQQQLLSLALQEREHLLPYYAPMTLGRLRLCPLLHNLKKDQLESLLDYVQPRVFPANTVCSERSEPQHLFFVRRGTVRMEREQGEPSALSAQSYLQTPRSRALLVEGHTYGEAACIFRESLGDTYFAVSHADVYMLPFAALIQMMKQSPDAQSKVYDAARLLTAALEREVTGFAFRPLDGAVADGTVAGLEGLVPSSSVLLRRCGGAAQRNAAQQQQQQLLHRNGSLSMSGLGDNRRVSFALGGTPPPGLGLGNNINNNTANTSMDNAVAGVEGLTSVNTTDTSMAGAAAEAAVVEAMRRIPLLNLVGTTPFFADLAPCWRRRRYEKGDFVVRRGEECNRLVLFCDGHAAVIVNEKRYQRDLESSPFGIPDVECISASALAMIPIGFASGYTCTRRHRWARSVVALDDNVEVLELTRAALVQLLQRHSLERALAGAALQVMQPLSSVFALATTTGSAARRSSAVPGLGRPNSASVVGGSGAAAASRHGSVYTTATETSCPRAMSLDYQPLLHPAPNSLWACHPVPNLHPVVTSEFVGTARDRVMFPIWRDGDFPLPRVSTTAGGGEDGSTYSSDQSMVSGSRPLSRRATRANMGGSTETSPVTTPAAGAVSLAYRLNSGFDVAPGSGAGSGASSPLAASALARAEFQRRVQQEVI